MRIWFHLSLLRKGKEEEEEVRVFLAGFMLLLHSHEDSIRGELSFVSLFQKFLSILVLLFHQKWKHAHTHTHAHAWAV
jgi:hypothetical protein